MVLDNMFDVALVILLYVCLFYIDDIAKFVYKKLLKKQKVLYSSKHLQNHGCA